ncbi:DUF692 domain-containing protein [Hahella aquimaris]|uniref:MNIO family bufferin maturase n=1 Tax=Hahella sp. HNIBRBA332 TaxID=3015983 RepID=UPI00273B5271|nr:DUF692 domain-containing protein [Hahella sp. HNIBRBA332]WLQ12571.1 DUF692 domain-containing protein [Hahella sp. HNIBRBA332]
MIPMPLWRQTTGPISGAGIGLRSCHFGHILEKHPSLPWFEALTDNYLTAGGVAKKRLLDIASSYPVALHGVGMSLGGTEPLDKDYLRKLQILSRELRPAWISEHLCWTSVHGVDLHELMPLPYTEETIHHVAERIKIVQDIFESRILLENVSSYLTYDSSCMSEWEFLSQIAEEADCLLLLDINNIYVSAANHEFDPRTYIDAIPAQRVAEYHLAGFEDKQTHLLDTHGAPVDQRVWDLYGYALRTIGARPTLIERDNDIPGFEEVAAEAAIAQRMLEETDVAA